MRKGDGGWAEVGDGEVMDGLKLELSRRREPELAVGSFCR